jgi:dsDNA-binding SOS-regulon protein
MVDTANPDTNMDRVDAMVIKLAAMLDATMRFHVADMNLDEMEKNYISTWLRKERDPLLVTILATSTGDRDPSQNTGQNEGTND